MLAGRMLAAAGRGRTLGGKITVSSYVGDMSGFGNLAAAFDGTTNQTAGASAGKGSKPGYVGADLSAAPKRIFKVTCFGSNNLGYSNAGSDTVTLSLYGKNTTTPSSGTDGTVLGSISFTDTSNESTGRDIESNDQETLWDYLWIYVNTDAGSSQIFVAELEPYEAI